MTNKTTVRLLFFFLLVLALDQATKYVALTLLSEGLPVPVLGEYLRWTLAFNPGGAFGLRLGSSAYYLVFSLVIFAFLIYYTFQHRRIGCISLPLAGVAGGAAGNIIDRLRFGEVVDFIDCEFPDIHFGSYHMERWPIFNVADMAVSCGIILTVIILLFPPRAIRTTQIGDTPPSADTPTSPD